MSAICLLISPLDFQGRDAISDSSLWKSDVDKQEYGTDLFMGAFGLTHKLIMGGKTYISTTLAASGNLLSLNQKGYINSMNLIPTNIIDNSTSKYTLASLINYKFNARHTIRTGISIDRLQCKLDIQKADVNQNQLKTFVNEEGNSNLIQVYLQPKFQ